MSHALGAPDTSERILDIAEQLVQTRGFNGFSYADIAAELGITKASLHYHFPTKAKLGESLVERYQRNFLKALGEIAGNETSTLAKLEAYVKIYAGVLDAGRMCLCGMLAADYSTLPGTVQERVRAFFAANEAWLTTILSQGRLGDEISFIGDPIDNARFLVGALEGAMLLARTVGDTRRFGSVTEILLRGFAVGRGPGERSAKIRLNRHKAT
jgi:TetR/AcrR family transcriptional repressor of nem operon